MKGKLCLTDLREARSVHSVSQEDQQHKDVGTTIRVDAAPSSSKSDATCHDQMSRQRDLFGDSFSRLINKSTAIVAPCMLTD